MPTHSLYIPLARAILLVSLVVTLRVLVLYALAVLIMNGMGLYVLIAGLIVAADYWAGGILRETWLAWGEEERRKRGFVDRDRDFGGKWEYGTDSEMDDSDSD